MRGYPHPVPVFGLRRRAQWDGLRFLCKLRGYPPSHALRCPPTRADRVTPSDPTMGSASLRPAPPTHGNRWGVGVPPPSASGGVGIPPCPPRLQVPILRFSWNSRRSTLFSSQCQTGGIPPTRGDQVTPYPPYSGLRTYPPTPHHSGGRGYPPLSPFRAL